MLCGYDGIVHNTLHHSTLVFMVELGIPHPPILLYCIVMYTDALLAHFLSCTA